MKKFYTIIAAVLITANLFAQTPQKMSYQAVVRNSSDQLVTNQGIGMQVSILQSSATGTAVYVETQNTNTNANGLVSIEIGAGTLVSGDFSTIDWANGPYFIKTETDPTTAGGTNYTITGTSQLLSVAYALHANETQNLSQVLAQSNDAGTQIKNLTDPTDAQDAVTKAYVDLLEARISALENPPITDIDGNSYQTVTIGDQVWMAENLKVTKYNDGTEIPIVTDNTAWTDLSAGAYCWYDNDAPTYKDVYGAMYNWYTVTTGNLCPSGWHVPSDAEWTTLLDYLGGSSVAGGKLKETGTTHWSSPNTGATNETGFSALPGGYRSSANGTFVSVGLYGFWWSSTQYNSISALIERLDYDSTEATQLTISKKNGVSVRCIKE